MQRREWIAAAFTITLCSAVIWWPILTTDLWYKANQAYRYPYLLDLFKASFFSGHLYPRWLPELAGGYGFPTFVYYPPGFWFTALPFSLLFSTTLAVKLTMLLSFAIGGVSTYLLSKKLGANGLTACAAIAVFLCTPYVPHQIYFRGSFSELQAMMLSPLLLLCYITLCERVALRQRLFGAVLSLGASYAYLTYTHVIIALWIAISLGFMALVDIIRSPRKMPLLLALAAAGIIGLSLSLPYWYDFLILKNEVRFHNAMLMNSALSMSKMFIYARPFVMFSPFIVLLAVEGLLLRTKSAHALAALVALVMMLFLMSSASDVVWNHIALFRFTQLRMRLVSATAMLQIIGITYLCVWLQGRWPRAHNILAAAVIVWSIGMVIPALKPNYPVNYADYKEETMQSFNDMTHHHEFIPVQADLKDLKQRVVWNIPILESTGDAPEHVTGRDDDIHAGVSGPATLIVNQLMFPGWRADMDGTAPPLEPDASGRITLQIPAGKHELHVWFSGEKGDGLRVIAALMLTALTGACVRWRDRKTLGA